MKKNLCIIMNMIVTTISFFILLLIVFYFLGIKPTIVSSGSMEPSLPVGSLCMIDTKYPIENVKINDIIVYYVKKQKVIHRVYNIQDGIIQTKGDANANVDRASITEENYYGRYLFSIPMIGYLITQFQSTIGRIVFVSLMVLLYSFWYFVNSSYQKEREK